MITEYIVKENEDITVTITQTGKYLVKLVGEGGSVKVRAKLLIQSSQVCKVELVVHHLAKHTTSQVLLKAVGKDRSTIELKGRVIVAKKCSGVDAQLTQRVLMLNDKVSVSSIPELEILTNSVSCSHASSITKIPTQQLQYLMSRGITNKRAEELIVEGFLQEKI